MARLLTRLLPLLLVGLLVSPLLSFNGALADDAVIDEEESVDDMSVEDESEETVTIRGGGDSATDEGEDRVPPTQLDEEDEEEEEEEFMIGPSSDAKTIVIFTNKDKDNIVAGEIVDTLIGFTNVGKQNFIVTGIEASLRYPQDFSYHIQNFSMFYYERYVEPNAEVSFTYSFIPSDTLFARPFGLVLNVYYKDEENNQFRDSVFNNTISIVEFEEGFDPETFFMYVFMVSGLCLLMFVVHYVYTTVKRGGRSVTKKQPQMEMGTQKKKNAVDLDWIPENHITKKSPRKSPRSNHSSPRNKQKSKLLTTPNVD